MKKICSKKWIEKIFDRIITVFGIWLGTIIIAYVMFNPDKLNVWQLTLIFSLGAFIIFFIILYHLRLREKKNEKNNI